MIIVIITGFMFMVVFYPKYPKPKIRLGIKRINATATGSTYNQHSSISWSYRNRGSVALNQTKQKQKTQVFIPNAAEDMFNQYSARAHLSEIIEGKL